MEFTVMQSSLGDILLAGETQGLRLIHFLEGESPLRRDVGWVRNDVRFAGAVEQLRAYFAGELKVFDLRLAPQGTPFYQQVWRELQAIPYGETITYGELARRVGKPNGARAVGLANGRNPLPVVVPCHRVIGADGSLIGYGGGLHIKRALLDLEQRHRGMRAGEQLGMEL